LKTQVAYDVPSVFPADYAPEPEPDLPPFSAANRMQMRVAAHAAQAKEVKKLADIKPKFFNAIFAKTSVASRLLMEADGECDVANAALDQNALYAHSHKKDIVLCYFYYKGAFPSTDPRQLVRVLDFLGLSQDFTRLVFNLYNEASTEFVTPYGHTPSLGIRRGTAPFGIGREVLVRWN
jgi:hypothetical protein